MCNHFEKLTFLIIYYNASVFGIIVHFGFHVQAVEIKLHWTSWNGFV